MIRRRPRSTQSRSSAASDVYKRQPLLMVMVAVLVPEPVQLPEVVIATGKPELAVAPLSLIHISEPTRLLSISYAVFCLKKKNYNF